MSEPVCKSCGVGLVCPDNWRPSRAKIGNRICTPCRRAYEVNRLATNAAARERARQTSASYRESKPEEAKAATRRWLDAHPNYMKNWRERKKLERANAQN